VSAVTKCAACGAKLAPWERGQCACRGPRLETIREVLYAVACGASSPLHARDYVRNAARDYRFVLTEATAIASLAPDPRFCWAGRGLYGLFRHGPLPGPRTLLGASRFILFSAGAPLGEDALDFCMKRFGYRYNVASLHNAITWSFEIVRRNGWWDHARDEEAKTALRREFQPVPPPILKSGGALEDTWPGLLWHIRRSVHEALANRKGRLQVLADRPRYEIEWDADSR